MEEIDLKELWDYFLSKIYYVILIVAISIILGMLLLIFVIEPVYESSTTLILTGFSGTDENSAITTSDITINQQLITTYQEIATSKKVLSQVISKLDLDYSVEELASEVTVTNVSDTAIIKITVADADASLSYEIVTQIAEVFSEEVKDFYNLSNVSILDSAEIAEDPSNISIVKTIFISLLAGLIISCLIIFICFYFDDTVRSVSQIESKLKVPILGSVPVLSDNVEEKKRGILWKS